MVSLSSVISAFEDASGYLNYSHVKRMEFNGSVHLCIIAVDGDADKPHNGNIDLGSLDEKDGICLICCQCKTVVCLLSLKQSGRRP